MKKILATFFICLLFALVFVNHTLAHGQQPYSLAAATPSPGDAPAPPDAGNPSQNGKFTILWISDTQDIAYHRYGDAFSVMGKWIAENRVPMNIRYVVQTGDAVDNGASQRQWDSYDEMFNQFKDDIPYISVAGNHEVKKNGYLEFCARPEVQAIPPDRSFENGIGEYATFEAYGKRFLIIGAGYGEEQRAVPWINSVLRSHRDHIAILLFHDYLQTGGRFSVNGKSMFEQIVIPNPNVFMVLCGHVCGVSSRIDEIDDDHDGIPDRAVHEMMYNYQDRRDDCGQLRTLEFDTNECSVLVTTYSPVTQRYYRDYMFGDRAVFKIEHAFPAAMPPMPPMTAVHVLQES